MSNEKQNYFESFKEDLTSGRLDVKGKILNLKDRFLNSKNEMIKMAVFGLIFAVLLSFILPSKETLDKIKKVNETVEATKDRFERTKDRLAEIKAGLIEKKDAYAQKKINALEESNKLSEMRMDGSFFSELFLDLYTQKPYLTIFTDEEKVTLDKLLNVALSPKSTTEQIHAAESEVLKITYIYGINIEDLEYASYHLHHSFQSDYYNFSHREW